MRIGFTTRLADEAWETQDTVLQDIQALVVTFYVTAEIVPPSPSAKPQLNRALAAADQVILLARPRLETFVTHQPSSLKSSRKVRRLER